MFEDRQGISNDWSIRWRGCGRDSCSEIIQGLKCGSEKVLAFLRYFSVHGLKKIHIKIDL